MTLCGEENSMRGDLDMDIDKVSIIDLFRQKVAIE
jgi:hypothetical protein